MASVSSYQTKHGDSRPVEREAVQDRDLLRKLLSQLPRQTNGMIIPFRVVERGVLIVPPRLRSALRSDARKTVSDSPGSLTAED